MAPLGPKGPPKMAPLGALGHPWAPLGPWGPKSDAMGAHKFENLPNIYIVAFFGSKMGEKKLGFRPRDPHGEIRARILRILPPEMSKTVGWRPIW